MASTKMFTKEQLVNSKTFELYRDYLMGNLEDNKTYTKEQVNKMINDFYGKGKCEK